MFLCCLCYYCSINVKRQSELSGLCPDTSSLVSVCFSLFPNFLKSIILELCVEIDAE